MEKKNFKLFFLVKNSLLKNSVFVHFCVSNLGSRIISGLSTTFPSGLNALLHKVPEEKNKLLVDKMARKKNKKVQETFFFFHSKKQ